MNLNTLQAFRHEAYDCFQRAADALFNTADALLSESQANSFPELSLSPFFERRWPSLYEAFEDGCIDTERLQEVFVRHLPSLPETERLWLGIDASSIARPESQTSADRSVVYVPNQVEQGKPISYGWQFSTVMVLPQQPSSWSYILSQRRIASHQKSTHVAAEQVEQVLKGLPVRPIITSDRWYSCHDFLVATHDLAADKLLRVKRNRVFYRAAPPPSGKRGAPRKDGDRFQCSDPSSQAGADEQWQGSDEHGQRIEVMCWKNLHLRTAREIALTLFRVLRHGASESQRDPKESWFLWTGETSLPLCEVPTGYKRRYSVEHTYRFGKQALLWSLPRLRTPEQFERWTQIVALVHNQLVLARPVVNAQYRPWENPQRAASPQQVRRAMAPILHELGTPAKACQPRGKSAGRAKGTSVKPATRYEVVRKPKKVPIEA